MDVALQQDEDAARIPEKSVTPPLVRIIADSWPKKGGSLQGSRLLLQFLLVSAEPASLII
jgi:hypothetical protein